MTSECLARRLCPFPECREAADFSDDLQQSPMEYCSRTSEKGRKSAMRLLFAAVIAMATCSATLADPGDADKAKAMLARVVEVVQKDQSAAMQKFNAGSDGFRDGSIYPFCFRLEDGIVITGQTAGTDIRTFPGNSGQQIFEAAQKPEDVVTEIAYMARKPPPADATPTKKVSVVRRIGQVGCGVGYYP
jgi:hypothetical protein